MIEALLTGLAAYVAIVLGLAGLLWLLLEWERPQRIEREDHDLTDALHWRDAPKEWGDE